MSTTAPLDESLQTKTNQGSDQYPTASAAETVNIAGRQRMLNQRYVKEVLMARSGLHVDPQGTMELLKKTAIALSRGGRANLILGPQPVQVLIPEPASAELGEVLSLQPGLLLELELAGLAALGEASDTNLARLDEACSAMHAVANDGTSALAQYYSDREEALERSKADLMGQLKCVLGEIPERTEMLQVSASAAQEAGRSIERETSMMAGRVDAIASACASLDQGLRQIDSAMGEMTTTIDGVSIRTVEASTLSLKAVDASDKTMELIVSMKERNAGIKSIVAVINLIARQTDLLALNASVEASRAGAAGLGFAVIAREVKDLANKTATATTDIEEMLFGIEDVTQSVTVSVGEVSEANGNLCEFSQMIAATVEQQAATTKDMSHNLRESVVSMNRINTDTRHLSSNAETTLQEAKGAAQQIKHTSDGIDELRKLVLATLRLTEVK